MKKLIVYDALGRILMTLGGVDSVDDADMIAAEDREGYDIISIDPNTKEPVYKKYENPLDEINAAIDDIIIAITPTEVN